MWKVAVLCALAVLPTLAGAQVTRCTDPTTGKVTYTDGLCASNEKSVNVARKRTMEEIAEDRAQAAEARERVRRNELAALRAGRDAPAPPQAVGIGGPTIRSADQVVDKTGTIDCKRARHNLAVEQSKESRKPNLAAALVDVETACGIDASKYMPKAKERRRNPCDAGGCRDNMGNTYSGSSGTVIRQDGAVCQWLGNQVDCR